MKVLKSKILASNENEDCITAEIVDDVTEEEREEFETYEMIAEEDLTQEEKQKLSELVKKYLKSYSKYKDKLSLQEWLLMMYREDFPEMEESKLLEMAETTVKNTEKNYKILEELRKDTAIGLDSSDYFAAEISEDEEFKKIEDKNSFLKKLNEDLIQEGINNIYETAFLEEEKAENKEKDKSFETAGKVLGQKAISDYFLGIDKTIETANEKMWGVVHNLDGSINMNPNLDGYIMEQDYANTFNLNAAAKNIKDITAEVLVPDGKSYGKNSVDIVITETRKGKKCVVKKYQVKFGADAKATAGYFYDKDGYRYKFQQKLVPKEQAENIPNAVDTISYKDVESLSKTKEEAKNLQSEIQNGNAKAADIGYENVETINMLKSTGKMAVRNAVMAGVASAGFNIGKKIITGEEIETEEVVAEAVKTGGNIGVSTAVSGALTTAAKKGITKGILADNNVISAIAFSTVECISSLYKMGTGEYSFKEGMDSIGENLTAGYISAKSFILGSQLGIVAAAKFATLAGMMAAPAAVVTVSGIVGGTLLAMAGSSIAGAVYNGAKAVVKETVKAAKTVVSAGCETVKTVAGCVWSGINVVENTVVSGMKAVGSALSSFGSRIFRF